MRVAAPSPLQSLRAPHVPLSPAHLDVPEDAPCDLVLGIWELREIDRELHELEQCVRSLTVLRHPLVCLRLHRQIEALRTIRSEQHADLEALISTP